MKELIATGVNVDEAVAEACERLGASRDDVSVEVLEMPQKKLFGMSPAKVKVTLEREPVQQPPKEERPERAQNIKPPREPREPRAPRAESEAPRAPETETPVAVEGSVLETLEYLKTIAGMLGAKQIEYEVVETESGLKFKADGEDAALLIGRRGDTMGALQYLCSLVYNRGEKEYHRVIVDVANYREKRERNLEQLARNTAIKVQRTRRSQTLEPMNPYERRIIHSTVQRVSGVKSESVGEEPYRRVVISTEGAPSKGGRPDRGRGGRNRRGGQPAERRQAAAPAAAEAPEAERQPEVKKNTSGSSLPLYSKIEL